MSASGQQRPVALVTGASRGLGAALAEALSPTHHIIAVARTVGALEALDDRIRARGGSATIAAVDLAQAAAVASLCKVLRKRHGQLATWCHTAIYAPALAPVRAMDTDDWKVALTINVAAVADLIAHVAPLLGPRARVVFFDDQRAGQKFFGAYGATKAAQMALAKSWQAESRVTGPQVIIAAPRAMATRLRARFFPGENRAALARPEKEARRLLLACGVLSA